MALAAKICTVSTLTFILKTMRIWEGVRLPFGRCVSLEVTQEKTADPRGQAESSFFVLCIQNEEREKNWRLSNTGLENESFS